jgi:hypothetical protein
MRATSWIIGSAWLPLALHARSERVGAQASAPRYLDRVSLTVESLSQVDRHFVYTFRVANGAASRAGVSLFGFDASAPRGTGHEKLAARGEFRHWPSERTTRVPRDHVPAGPASPDNWKASLDVDGRLEWWGINGGVVDEDSIAPGQFLDGFGIRSTYLPGIRDFWAEPTWQSCCSQPKPGSVEGEHPKPSEFRWTGRTIAPTVRPSQMTLTMLNGQLAETCAVGWLSASNCSAVRPLLERARQLAEERNRKGAVDQLGSFVAALDERRGDAASVHPNAYWLLRTNASHLMSQFRD